MTKIILDFPSGTKTIDIPRDKPIEVPTDLQDMGTPNSPYEHLGYGAADFDIAKSDLTYVDREGKVHTSSKHTIYRTDTGAELGVHGKNYANIEELSYKRMIDNQRNILDFCDLNTLDMKEDIAISGNGKRLFLTHTLPNEVLRTPDGDTANLSFLTAASLDSTAPFTMTVGAEQKFCTNGQLFINNAAMLYRNKHNKQLRIDEGARLILNATEICQKELEMWHTWHDLEVSNIDAMKILAKVAKHKSLMSALSSKGMAALFEEEVKYGSAFGYLLNKWNKDYRGRLGQNMWALYNTITDWVTHAPASRKDYESNISKIQSDRREEAKKVIKSEFPVALAA